MLDALALKTRMAAVARAEAELLAGDLLAQECLPLPRVIPRAARVVRPRRAPLARVNVPLPATMGALAARALSIIFSEHAGCLGSFKADQRVRLMRAYDIVGETEAAVTLVYRCRVSYKSMDKYVGRLRCSMITRIRRLSPAFIPKSHTFSNPWPLYSLVMNHIGTLQEPG
jgi:hypothetical protein